MTNFEGKAFLGSKQPFQFDYFPMPGCCAEGTSVKMQLEAFGGLEGIVLCTRRRVSCCARCSQRLRLLAGCQRCCVAPCDAAPWLPASGPQGGVLCGSVNWLISLVGNPVSFGEPLSQPGHVRGLSSTPWLQWDFDFLLRSEIRIFCFYRWYRGAWLHHETRGAAVSPCPGGGINLCLCSSGHPMGC